MKLYPKIVMLSALSLIGKLSVFAQESKKNLLFIITDQQRYDALGLAGNSIIQTPNLDRLGSEGAYFSNAYTPCAVCCPARSSILTGSTVEHTEMRSNGSAYYDCEPTQMNMPTFDEILSENGYRCEYYGKWHTSSYHSDVYENPQLTANNGGSIFGPGGQTYMFRDYLEGIGQAPTPGDGEFIDGMSKWPYLANPLDKYFGMSYQDLLNQSLVHSQPDQHGELQLNQEHTMTAFQAKQTLEAIERLKDSVFSITCSFQFPHAPMLPAEPYASMYPVENMPTPASINDNMQNSPYLNTNGRLNMPEYADPDKIKYMISNYYALVTEIDHWVGQMLTKLDELNLSDNTLVIFTSDHGEMLGAHGMREKNVFYEESAHIPLLIRYPGNIIPATTVDGCVSLVDLFPTIMDYLGVEEIKSDGKSLRGLIENTDTEHGKYVVTEWDYNESDNISNFMVVKDGWKLLIPYSISSTVLNAMYDLNTDPHEINNLLGSNPDRAQYLDEAEELRACLLEWLEKNGSEHYYSVMNRDLLDGGKPTGNSAAFVSQEVPELTAGANLPVSITMKNTGSTAWTTEGLFKLGSQSPEDNLIWGINRVSLNDGESIQPSEEKSFNFNITVPESDGMYNFQWQMIQEGEEWFGVKSNMRQVIFGDPGSYLDDCDDLSDWKSSVGLNLNSIDQQQGMACIEFTGSSTDEFKKIFTTPFDSRGSPESTELRFWYYVSDVSLFDASNQLELGSGGAPDNNEYNWQLNNLTNGWNYIVLKVSDAGKIGTPDLSAINWFRIYHFKLGTITTRIDGIQLIDPNADPVYSLIVNDGSGTGTYLEGEQVSISAFNPPSGYLFDTWLIDSGDPSLADPGVSTTTLTMGAGNTVVSATYRETQKYNVTVQNGSGDGEYSPGNTVVIQADNPSEGMLFDQWIVNSGTIEISNVNSEFTYFTMPEEDVELIANFNYPSQIIDETHTNGYVFNMYPNPLNGNLLNIELDGFKDQDAIEFSIHNLLGQLVYQTLIQNKKHLEIDTSELLNKSTYIVTLKSSQAFLTSKLIVK